MTVKVNINGVNELDFPSGVSSATMSGGVATITLSGGGGGSSFTVVTTAVNYTANPLDDVWASGTINITTPAATSGNRFKVTNRGVGTITVLPASGTISGQASYQLKRQYTAIELVSDGTNWAIE